MQKRNKLNGEKLNFSTNQESVYIGYHFTKRNSLIIKKQKWLRNVSSMNAMFSFAKK